MSGSGCLKMFKTFEVVKGDQKLQSNNCCSHYVSMSECQKMFKTFEVVRCDQNLRSCNFCSHYMSISKSNIFEVLKLEQKS